MERGDNMVGERIRNLRIDARMTQEELGLKVGVTKQTVSSWEKGISTPNYDILVELSNIFQVSTDFLLGKTDDPKNVKMDLDPKKESISDAEATKILEQKFIENGILKESEHLSDEKLDKYLKMLRALQDIADAD